MYRHSFWFCFIHPQIKITLLKVLKAAEYILRAHSKCYSFSVPHDHLCWEWSAQSWPNQDDAECKSEGGWSPKCHTHCWLVPGPVSQPLDGWFLIYVSLLFEKSKCSEVCEAHFGTRQIFLTLLQNKIQCLHKPHGVCKKERMSYIPKELMWFLKPISRYLPGPQRVLVREDIVTIWQMRRMRHTKRKKCLRPHLTRRRMGSRRPSLCSTLSSLPTSHSLMVRVGGCRKKIELLNQKSFTPITSWLLSG
jgi:hypothetical protein